jgi:hypothetical protein
LDYEPGKGQQKVSGKKIYDGSKKTQSESTTKTDPEAAAAAAKLASLREKLKDKNI